MRIPTTGIAGDDMKPSRSQISMTDDSSSKMRFQTFIKQEVNDSEVEEKPKIFLNIPLKPEDDEEDSLAEGLQNLNLENIKTEPDDTEEEEKEEIDEDKLVTKGPEVTSRGKRIISNPYTIPGQTFSHFKAPIQDHRYIGLSSPATRQGYVVQSESTSIEEVIPTIEPLPGSLEDVMELYKVDMERLQPATVIKKDEPYPSPPSVKSDEGYISQSPTCSPNPHTSPPYEPLFPAPLPSPIRVRHSPPTCIIPSTNTIPIQSIQRVAVYPTNILSEQPRIPVPRPATQLQQAGRVVQESQMKISSYDRMQKRMNVPMKFLRWQVLCQKHDVYGIDDQGETDLMKALRQPPKSRGFFESIYVLVERIKKDWKIDYLMKRNSHNHSALYIAATELYHTPILARYIADTIAQLKHNPDEVFGGQDNSLLHILPQVGENCAEVIGEFLNAEEGKEKLFDVNRKNTEGNTPLHLAIFMNSVTIAKLLVSHGADLSIKNGLGLTPLHFAIKTYCNPTMIKQLLGPSFMQSYVDIADLDKNTPLHYAAAKNDVPMSIQEAVITLLVESRAKHNLRNKDGRVALHLVDPRRKEVIQRILNKKSSKMAYGK